MHALSPIILLALLVLPTAASAEFQTFTATHTYILGDHDSKDDARQRCLLEAKRKVLEQAGIYIESAAEVKDFQLTKDKISSFAAAVMQVKDTKEQVGFENGHMTITLTLKADVDLAEVRKQLAARQVDKGVRDEVAAQTERLKRLEAQLEAMQQERQGGQVPAQTYSPQASDISAADVQMLKTQAAQGSAIAQVELGYRYALGNGVPQDYATARQWYEKAAAQSRASAQFNLGKLYEDGLGVPYDYVKARQWYEKAAAQGHKDSQYYLGELYADGAGVSQDYVKARQWYEKAAAQGDDNAQISLGELYEYGHDGVPQDYVKARQWYEKAAAQGQWRQDRAAVSLGNLYEHGRGVPQDYVKARLWYEKAAAAGLFWQQKAQSSLGNLYEHGHGVPQDYARAYMWFSLAAEKGFSTSEDQKTAAGNRDMVARRMTPVQLAEAQRLAQQCQARQSKGC